MTPERSGWVRAMVRAITQLVLTVLWIYLVFFAGAVDLWLEAAKLLILLAWCVNLSGWLRDIVLGKAAQDKY